MVNQNHNWNEITNVGNPTRSQVVNDIIKRVKKFEAQKQGSPSKAQLPQKEHEYQSIIGTHHKEDDIVAKYGIPAVINFQFHMIGRLDVCGKFLQQNLQPNDQFLKSWQKGKLSWSINVHKERERNAPFQHILP